MKKIPYIILGALTVFLFSCGPKADKKSADGHSASETEQSHEGHDHAAEGHNHEAEEGHNHEGHNHASEEAEHNHAPGESCSAEPQIELSQKQAHDLGLTYRIAEQGEFSGSIHVSGVVEPALGDAMGVVAPVSGIVEFVSKNINVGQKVAKGTKLMVIKTSSLGAGNQAEQVANARATLKRAETELSRVESLLKENITTQSQYSQALLDKQIAGNALRSLTVGGGKDGNRYVVAPQGGYITEMATTQGQYVEQGQSLMTISSLAELVVKAYVPQRYAAQLQGIDKMNFAVPSQKDKIYKSKKLISRGMTATSGMVEVRFATDYALGLLPGGMVEGYLLTAPRQGVISVPLTALTDEQGAKYAYIRVAPDKYVKRHVILGESNGVEVEILKGINPKDDVVTRGAYFVKLASASTAIPHGHSH